MINKIKNKNKEQQQKTTYKRNEISKMQILRSAIDQK